MSIYLDNAATTFPKPSGILDKTNDWYKNFGSAVGRSSGSQANEASQMMNETRFKLSKHFDINYPECVIFSPSASIALNQLILGLNKFKNFYFSPFEHNSVLRPINSINPIIKRNGDYEFQIPFNEDFSLNFGELERKFELNIPDVVCLTQISNVTGFKLPIYEIMELAKEYNPGVISIIDGAQSAGYDPVSLKDFDYYVYSGHKSFHAGYGIAGFVMDNPEKSKLLQTLHYGGTGTISEEKMMPDFLPSKFEVGSHNVWAIKSLNEALKWLENGLPKNNIEMRKKFTLEIIKSIKDNDNLNLYKQENDDYPIISFNHVSNDLNTIKLQLEKNDIVSRSGFHCSPLAHEFLRTDKRGGTTRLSPGLFNTWNDFSILNEIILKI